MATSEVTFFPVDNGGMTLIKLNDEDETSLLIDIHIRKAADDDNDDTFDVASSLREQLKHDSNGRPYVDVFLLTHNDDDHIKGIEKHFHLGDPEDYKEPKEDEDPKIMIQEMWSSSRFWKRASDSNNLCDDAKLFNKEMKRRVKLFEDTEKYQDAGNRALIIGKDPDGKTDNIEKIVRDINSTFSRINRRNLSEKLSIKVLGPIPQQDNEEDEDYKKKNRGSVILQFNITEGEDTNKVLMTGDAEVFVWECLWKKYKSSLSSLEYDILLAPHHCSWHSLSHDSQSDNDDPKVSSDARNALSQARAGAFIISSSKEIKEKDSDPPSSDAKKEYENIVGKSKFKCTAEYPKKDDIKPIVIKLTKDGSQLKGTKAKSRQSSASSISTSAPLAHG